MNMKNRIEQMLDDAVCNGKIDSQEFLAIAGALHYAARHIEDFAVEYGTRSVEPVKGFGRQACNPVESAK
jgi:hypothetical protein